MKARKLTTLIGTSFIGGALTVLGWAIIINNLPENVGLSFILSIIWACFIVFLITKFEKPIKKLFNIKDPKVMKKYTIEEIRKWIDGYDPVFSGSNDILADLDKFGEKAIDEANGYIPDTHVESENKFISPLCDCAGEDGIGERDTIY